MISRLIFQIYLNNVCNLIGLNITTKYVFFFIIDKAEILFKKLCLIYYCYKFFVSLQKWKKNCFIVLYLLHCIKNTIESSGDLQTTKCRVYLKAVLTFNGRMKPTDCHPEHWCTHAGGFMEFESPLPPIDGFIFLRPIRIIFVTDVNIHWPIV